MKALGLDVQAVVFDLDGTLLDSERAITEAGALAFAELGVAVTPLQIADHLGAPLQELYQIFVGDHDEPRLRRFVASYIARHDEHPDRFPPPLPGVRAGLEALRARGLPLGVATTKPSARAAEQLDGCGLLPLFTHVQGTDATMKPKPAPDVVLRACAGLGVPANAALMVGDTLRDVLAARAAGAHAALVAYDDARAVAAQAFGADAVIRSLTEL